MSNIQIYKKPELAVLSDEKKIVAYSDVEKLTIAKSIVVYLFNAIGVGSNANEKHHIELIKFIAEEKEFTPGEIKKAFDLVLRGYLEIDMFQQINCLIYGKVMTKYRKYKVEALRIYNQKEQERKFNEANEKFIKEFSIKDSTIKMFDNFKINNCITENTVEHIYKYLYDLGKFPRHTQKFKEEFLKKAKAVCVFNKYKKNKTQKTINSYSDETTTIVKRLIVDSYFRSLTDLNLDIEDEL